MSRYRIIAQCFHGELDIAEAMVKSHVACNWPKFSGVSCKIDDAVCSLR
ncbi:hypothetical protein PMN64_00345 [Bradyrhizobium sp. UFLA01-814]